MQRYMYHCLLIIGLLFTNSVNAAEEWDGKYEYHTSLGTTVGGSVIMLMYELSVSKTDCTLNIDGYQTMDRIKCRADAKGDQLLVRFKSYADGSVKNPFGIEIYKVDAVLFELLRKDGKLVTTWKAEQPENLTEPGEYFIKADSKK
ncbi:MAG: DUF5991 domain-containing protein [Gammaproteobacteria bacterium]|nr:DUF5991 domain-containing protein [Gammaproteobacteria bacterium]